MFECCKCGEGCKHLDMSPLYKQLDRGDGTCIYLKDDLCSIYENRPLICRIDECYEYFKEEYTLEEYYAANQKMCIKLISMKKS